MPIFKKKTCSRCNDFDKRVFDEKNAIANIFRDNIRRVECQTQEQNQQVDRYAVVLSQPIIAHSAIQLLAWGGVPATLRPKIWKFLLRYDLLHDEHANLKSKRAAYSKLLRDYWHPQLFTADDKKIYHTIDMDVRRGEFGALYKGPKIQQSLCRTLFVWHNRHPASGYVQSMCDIALPFFSVFASEYILVDAAETLTDETLELIQADVYWCVSKLIEQVTQNYTLGFEGLKGAHQKICTVLNRIDPPLTAHFSLFQIDLFSFTFRSLSTLLLRLFKPSVGTRLLDTFLAYDDQYPQLMMFLVIVILEKYSAHMLKCKFEDLMQFIQNLPTKLWQQQQLTMVIAQAYTLLNIFGESKS